jgi:hypothetical protein
MDKSQAVTLIEDVFDNKFSEEKFSLLCSNLLNDFNKSKATPVQAGSYVYEPYRNHIKSFRRIGQYVDPKGEVLDVLSVKVHDGFKLERTRTGLRNFAIEYLKRKEDRDTLLIAFHADDNTEWRFSFIKLDYKTVKDDKGRIKAKQEATSAKRYSFLVGEHEPCHTAKHQLLPLLLDTDNNPTLTAIEQCFNIERVTKEFFEQYKTLFVALQEHLDSIVEKDKKIAADFKEKSIETTAFSKKLLGQIVFLYFIQKKGWLGVPKDKGFGQGEKRFLKELFKKAEQKNQNFFNEYLEPLFYEALAVQRASVGDASYYKRFDCKIPFLNGGLFEPIKDYDWKNTDIIIPNEVFSNTTTIKDGDIGTGILDVFDRYNFTVKEDEPLEKEVAVDPEMLGKVFENLLEVKDRKSKGAFYTPREIVHYMCEESLVNYLDTALNTAKEVTVNKEDIYAFIKNSHLVIEDNRKDNSSYTWKLPSSIQTHASLFDKALADIKVCDPAIGSGAFPVGMLSEIVKARTALTPYLKSKVSADERTLYHLKRECIQNSLYGVDIDESAIDIAKLRLWLSLVVDEDDIQDIEPLPNLDYKIICGDSLVGVNTLDAFIQPALEKIEPLKIEYFSATDRNKKEQLKHQIESLFQLTMKNAHLSDNTFEFKFHFSEVWHNRNGFDVVIGNPPYVQVQNFSGQQIQKNWEEQDYKTFVKTGDVYCLFYEKGYQILGDSGTLAFITSNKWMRANYGKPMRKFFLENGTVQQLIDFGDSAIFENATTYTNILLWSKAETKTRTKVWDVNRIYKKDLSLEEMLDSVNVDEPLLQEESFVIVKHDLAKIKKRIENVGVPLKDWDISIYRGILTGLNEAFIINGKKKDELIAQDPKSAEIIKPILRGRDIKRYKADFADLWLITTYPALNIDIGKYPAIKKHLQAYGKRLEQSGEDGCRKKTHNKWFELQDSISYHEEFAKEKLLFAEIVYDSAFYFDRDNFLPEATTFILTGENIKTLVAFLNSTLLTEAFRIFYAGGDLRGNTFRYKKVFLENLPVPKLTNEKCVPFEILVDCIQYAKVHDMDSEAGTLESVVDGLVYDLYFPEEMKKADCYITDRITEVISPFKPDDMDEFKRDYVKKLADFCHKDKTVYHGIIFRRTVKIVEIISGAKK